MKPATAGRILSQDDLQTFSFCSELWNFGGSREHDPPFAIVRTALEYLLADSLRKNLSDPMTRASKYVAKAAIELGYHRTRLDAQVETWASRATLWLSEYYALFPPNKYHVVSGPLQWRIQISRTPVDVRVSGVLRTEDYKTLHVLYFTPYASGLDKMNDPVVIPLLETLKAENLVRASSHRPEARIHFLGYRDTMPYLAYTSLDTNEAKSKGVRAQSIVKAMEAGIHYPQLPCRYNNCPFKNQCNTRQQ